MATKTAAAQRKVAAKPAFKGKYPGPDKYKGKPPPKAAPKAKAAPKPAAARVTVPVANSTGSLTSPDQWQQDQARLVAAREDQNELLDLNDQESEAGLEYQTQESEAQKELEQRKLAIQKQKDDFARQKQQERADLGSNLSYRGVGSRGSAANRKWGELNTQHANTEANFTGQETAATTDYGNVHRNLETAKNTRLTSIAGRRQALAGRASAAGSYTDGTNPVSDTGVQAPKPVSLKPAPAKKAPAKKAPAKKAPAKKPAKKVPVKAAQRRVATKGKK